MVSEVLLSSDAEPEVSVELGVVADEWIDFGFDEADDGGLADEKEGGYELG